jgi:hypothetical protein
VNYVNILNNSITLSYSNLPTFVHNIFIHKYHVKRKRFTRKTGKKMPVLSLKEKRSAKAAKRQEKSNN